MPKKTSEPQRNETSPEVQKAYAMGLITGLVSRGPMHEWAIYKTLNSMGLNRAAAFDLLRLMRAREVIDIGNGFVWMLGSEVEQ